VRRVLEAGPGGDYPAAVSSERRAFDRVRGRGLLKMYGRTRALAGVDVELRAGEVTVIEGPNGSGKSTLLSLLALLARPTRGALRFGDRDAVKARRALRRHVGVLGHQSMLYPDLSGVENLHFFAGLYELPAAAVDEVLARYEIGAFGERPVRTCSRGQLQRLALARALLPRPTLVLLDEPSTGLDETGVDRLVDVVGAERERGAIVAIVTHDQGFAERVADRRFRLQRGKVAEA